MAATAIDPPAGPARRARWPLLLGLLGALLAGGGGFVAVYAGYLAPPDKAPAAEPLPPIAFVPLDPVTVALPPGSNARHLRLTAQLEVDPAAVAEVKQLTPRLLDVLNGYLRAVEVSMLEDPAELVRIRAQLLRRLQLVAGEGRIRDLLILEFLLN